jgi:hypothetical protein
MIMCMLLHKWSTWSDAVIIADGQVIQYRWCERCRKADVRLISYVKDNPADNYF